MFALMAVNDGQVHVRCHGRGCTALQAHFPVACSAAWSCAAAHLRLLVKQQEDKEGEGEGPDVDVLALAEQEQPELDW